MSKQDHAAASHEAVDRLLKEMSRPGDEEADYCSITLVSPDGVSIVADVFTHWVGYTVVDGRRHEVREASVLDAGYSRRLYEAIGREVLFVSTPEQLAVFYALGGTALVEADLAREAFPDAIAPEVSVQDGLTGFRSLAVIDDELAFRRSTTPKRRMAVLNRDGRRCRICGRRPDDHEDLELRVHHVRPWAQGGLTEERNLVTLCHTCHNGLDPHFDAGLYAYSAPETFQRPAGDHEYHEGVTRYRALVADGLGLAS